MRWLTRLGSVLLLVLACVAVAEVAARAFWRIRYPVPFQHPGLVLYAFYPDLNRVDANRPSRSDDVYDILILGGSVLHRNWGAVGKALVESLESEGFHRVRAFNMASPAHTARDSLLKYAAIEGAEFDLVVIYHGINEVRANNVPPELFREDYGHYSWYETVNALAPYHRKTSFALPYTYKYLRVGIGQLLHGDRYISTGPPRPEWSQYGATYNSVASFEANIEAILGIAEERGDPVLLMTFALHLPEDYSLETYKNHLAFSLPKSPLEVWGDPENVVGAVAAHNEVVRGVVIDHPDVMFVDQASLMAEGADRWFNDPCHLTTIGSVRFVDNMVDVLSDELEGWDWGRGLDD